VSAKKDAFRRPVSVTAAILLAARLFPNRAPAEEASWRHVTRLADAHFLVTGHVHLWDRWPTLEPQDRVRIARLLRRRPAYLASRTVFFTEVEDLLAGGGASEFAAGDSDDEVVMLASGDLGAQVDALLKELDRRAAGSAGSARTSAVYRGAFFSDVRVPDPLSPSGRAIKVHYNLEFPEPTDDVPLPVAAPAARMDELVVPLSDLEAVAIKLDLAHGETHRAKAVADLRKHLRDTTGAPLGELWRITAGATSTVHAPTGLGKNIAAELLALWCVCNGLVAALVVPQSAHVLKTVHRLRADLKILHREARVVPVISPQSMQELAQQTAASRAGAADYRDWVFKEMSYSCPLTSHASVVSQGVDVWSPGNEPCDRLVDSDNRRHSCPYRATCGKFRHHRAAVSADILVTNHTNFLVGRIHAPMVVDGATRQDVTTEEFLLRTAHVVVIDEIDALQAHAFERAAKDVRLARYGAAANPVRDLDEQFRQFRFRLDRQVEEFLHPKIVHLSWLAEGYVSHLARGTITPDRERRRMVVPRRWDAFVAARLFNLAKGERPTDEQMDAVSQLFTKGMLAQDVEALVGFPQLHALLSRITDLSDGTDNLSAGMLDLLTDAFMTATAAKDAADVSDLVQYSARRAYLEKIRATLHQIVGIAAPLRGAGMTASNDLADVLASHAPWRAAPYGPMGRPLFAFSEHFNENDVTDTSLTLKSFVGDPHAHIAYLGDITALAHARQRRVVLGMSATSHMPYAPRHHLLSPPTWYVPDDVNGGLSLAISLVQNDEDWVRVSGTSGLRRHDAYVDMGRALWPALDTELSAVAAAPTTSHRAHALIAYQAYEAGPLIAEGMIEAGADPREICVAVTAEQAARYSTRSPRWIPIPADQLEQFPHYVGDGNCRYLLAPMARVERGLNIVDAAGRSLLHCASLAVRPVLVMDDPPVLLSIVNSLSYRDQRGLTDDPAAELERLRIKAGQTFEDIRRGSHYFKNLGEEVKLSIVAEMLTRLIQLGGRTRRGGDHGSLLLVDAAFTETEADSTLPYLLAELRRKWGESGELDLISRIYRSTMTDTIMSLAATAEHEEVLT
jgi:hypothetical protein